MVGKREKIISFLAFVVLLCAAWGFVSTLRERGASDNTVSMDDGWDVSYQENTYHVDDASLFKVPFRAVIGDTIVLENVVPSYMPDHAVLRFRTYHSAVDVAINDSVFYGYGFDDPREKPFLGSGIHYVLMPMNPIGKKLRIRMIVYSEDSFNAFPHFDFLPEEKSISDYNAVHLNEIVIGLFLVIFGVIAILASAVGGVWFRRSVRMFMIGSVASLLGLWTLCYTKLIQAFSMDFAFNSLMEFYTLYLTPVPFSLLLYDMCKNSEKAWHRTTLKVFAIVDALFVLVTIILHLEDIVQVHNTLPVFHIFIFVGFLFVVVHVLPYQKNTNISGKILSLGVAIFGVTAFADLLRYNVYKFFTVRNVFFETTWIPFGVLAFVMLLLASYLYYLKDIIAAKTEKDVLAAMVYKDSLTGLYNRTKSSQIFDVLGRSNSDFAIISIDMNGLKVVNDRFGHIAGDKLIRVFGSVFKRAFDGIGTAIRMGGDEFLAIIRDEHLKDVDEAIKRMVAYAEEASSRTPVHLEAAYGIAYRSELGHVSADDVYREADKRMYDMKMSMKSDLVRR